MIIIFVLNLLRLLLLKLMVINVSVVGIILFKWVVLVMILLFVSGVMRFFREIFRFL